MYINNYLTQIKNLLELMPRYIYIYIFFFLTLRLPQVYMNCRLNLICQGSTADPKFVTKALLLL